MFNIQILILCSYVLTAFSNPIEESTKDAAITTLIKEFNLKPFQNKMVRNKSLSEIDNEKTSQYWKSNGLRAVRDRLRLHPNFNTARNVILFLGDGMSIPTIAATRVYLGGEEMSLSFEEFPYTGLSKTYCVDHQTADSACSATAYLGGVKSNSGTIGVTAAVNKENCTAMNMKENQVDSVARLFQMKGKKTGLVTTTRVTHASPAGVYAHTANRHWESDADVVKDKADPNKCEDIAHQLVYGKTGQKLNVILGGGRRNFIPQDKIDDEGSKGRRTDELNLIEQWQKIRKQRGDKHEYVWNKKQLLQISNDTEYLLGLFEPGHMQYNKERDTETDPSLEEMTEQAIKVLNRGNSNGFFLFVEGGRIDTAHHRNWAHKALDETAEFAKAVKKAVDITKEEETLIIVTADHAHTMSYAGYAARGSDVFGYAGKGSDNDLYSILNYANGPSYKPLTEDGKRYVASQEEMNEISFQWPATVPRFKETHGADDVAIFAKGPWSHLFTGVMEENVIPYLIQFAACVSTDIPCLEINQKLP
ncbi:membrane-bound alkaline phosphatase-like [Sitophilus oryzae]|uniref:alkaline phosphatase n=1 Tax=Sitophilus oryzae TaxID=7048 RepID=A0A6J2XJ55_SITOR|nr:membrane-bound alkaline phosphatase-like [Sitophilus oryzae]